MERETDGKIYELQADADGKRHAMTIAESTRRTAEWATDLSEITLYLTTQNIVGKSVT